MSEAVRVHVVFSVPSTEVDELDADQRLAWAEYLTGTLPLAVVDRLGNQVAVVDSQSVAVLPASVAI